MTALGLLARSSKTTATETPLLDALAKLDIRPIDQRAVTNYKLEKLNETVKTRLKELKAEKWQEYEDAKPRYEPEVRRALGAKWTDQDVYWYACHYATYPKCFAFGWHRMALASVAAPEFITRKAEQISNKVPGAIMEADVLESESRMYDPFLVVKLGAEEYYVDVWDEKDFESKM